MKIAFCGDSFCRDTTAAGKAPDTNYPILFSSWPYLVAKEYNGDIIAKGLPGRALFHSYEKLLEHINNVEYIIFCITDPYRLANKYGLSIIASKQRTWPEEFSPSKIKRLNYVINYYYRDIISFNWHEVAQKGLLMQIDELMIQKQKKCIWFPCFEHSMQGFVPKSGPIGNTPLFEISETELINANMTLNERTNFYNDIRNRAWNSKKMSRDQQTRVNHMNKENNNNMANLIIDIINNDDFTPQEIKMEKYFEISK